MFQDGQIVRTGLEYWAFAADQDGKHDYFWFQGFTSEFASSRAAVAEWATGREDELGMNYRFQGAGRGLADFEGNLFNFGQRNPKKIKLPENYRLLQALAARLRETFSGKVGRVFEWKRYGWRQWEPSWYRYQYIYEGPDVVSLVDGSSLPAYRFLVKPIGVKAPVEKLWVDQEGYPLRRVVRLGNADWELIAAKEPEAAKSKFVKWKALNQDHKKEAKAFLQSLGVWF